MKSKFEACKGVVVFVKEVRYGSRREVASKHPHAKQRLWRLLNASRTGTPHLTSTSVQHSDSATQHQANDGS